MLFTITLRFNKIKQENNKTKSVIHYFKLCSMKELALRLIDNFFNVCSIA